MRRFFPSRLLAWFLVLSVLVSCGGDEPIDPTPVTPVTPVDPNPPTPEKDTTAPTITLAKASVNIISGPSITVSGNELKIGDDLVASWKDDKTTSCTIVLSFTADGTSIVINSGDKLSEEGKLQVKVTDEAGNSSTVEITLTRSDTEAPKIEVMIQEKNVIAGVKVKIEGNQLFFDDQVAATWTDDFTEICSALLSLDGQAVNSGDILLETGKLVIAVSDDFKNETKAEITLLAEAVYGLENLQGKTLQVDQEVNMLEGITFANGLTLQKVEIEQDGQRSEIANPEAFTPEVPEPISIIFTLARTDGSTIEVKVENLTVRGFQYQSISITDLKPVEILPIIGQIEGGDKNAYDHIEHLRVAEVTRIRDMMWEYGAGKYSIDDYKELMGRLNIGITKERPLGYDNYESTLGLETFSVLASSHASNQWSILMSLIRYARYMSTDENHQFLWYDGLMTFLKNNPHSINVFWCSAYSDAYNYRDYHSWLYQEGVIEMSKMKNIILFAAGSNIETKDLDSWEILINKLYNGDYEADEHGYYFLSSMANSDKNTRPGSHLFVTIANQADGNIDQTNETSTSTKFPVGFADNVLFSGRAFPYKHYKTGLIMAEGGNQNNGRYSTSYTNPLNACMTGLCFQMYAEVPDVDVLLEMIRSTCLTDHIHLDLNGDGDTNDIIDGHPETLPLQLINPGGFFKKYCMPSSLQTTISTSEIIDLEKGYYKGVVFNIPGAEVKIGDSWIAFDTKNSDKIKTANPMDLEWRLNGTLLRKYGYTPSQTIQGQIITVDDQWNGLRLEKEFTIQIR